MSILSRIGSVLSLSVYVVDCSLSIDVGTNKKKYAHGITVGPGFLTINRDGDIHKFFGKDMTDHMPRKLCDFGMAWEKGNTLPMREEKAKYDKERERMEKFGF